MKKLLSISKLYIYFYIYIFDIQFILYLYTVYKYRTVPHMYTAQSHTISY